MTFTVLKVGLAIRAYGGTKENRPGIVLRLHLVDGDWWAFVAFGTSQPPINANEKNPPVFIDRSDPAFSPLGLDKPTWFMARGGGRLRDNDPTIRIVGECPPEVLVRVRELFGFK